MAIHAARGKLMGVIGDEDTCVGFLLGGVGELNKNRQPNFLVVDKDTAVTDIEDTLKTFIRREDISIILINQNVAEMVKPDRRAATLLVLNICPRRSVMFWTATRLQCPPSWRYPARTVPTIPTRTPS